MKIANPFRYEAELDNCHQKDAFVAVLPSGIGTKSALLEALASVLAFPAYFGSNWDALFDCFRDFSWMNEHDVVLIHPELPMLPESDLKIYLRLLRDSVLDWRAEEAHHFDVVFAKSDEEAVERLL
ncbi:MULTISPECIES: barstar family protein [unclassified Cupriavidus]|uniref:barstar family protein n=1 Tax=Cupriavidus sp. H19C3 TaxID=3241603 RepID=UPI003BF8D9BB